MAETIRELLIKIGLDSQAAVAGLNKIDGSFHSLKLEAALVIGAVTSIAGAFFFIARSAAKVGAELYKTSEILGIATGELQRLQGAANMAEVSTESLTSGLRFFGKTVGLAMQGGKEQIKLFHQAGIKSFKDVNGHIKSQSELLNEVADRMAHLKNSQEKLSMATQLFGRIGGSEMIPFLTGGSKKIKEMEKIFDTFGYTLSENDIANSRKFTWTLKILGMAMDGLKNKIGYAIMPSLNKWGIEVLKLIKEHRTFKGELNLFLSAAEYTFPTVTAWVQNTERNVKMLAVSFETLWEKTDKYLHISDTVKSMFKNITSEADKYGISLGGLGKKLSHEMGADYIGINPALVRWAVAHNYQPTIPQIGAASTRSDKQITVNNSPTINITVPAGTAESQQYWFKKAASEHYENAFQKELRNILLASPVYEGK